jgi:ribosomal protein S18 acetylase RimI-like enzyme
VARRSTLYRLGLDQLVIGPDGSLLAMALGWLDPVTLSLELEPVAVHPAWHRRGLGRAACLAAIRAGIALGATTGLIYAESHNQAALGLYASLGYEITTRVRPYQRPLLD